MVMGGICCKDSQVNAADNCTDQCPTAQFMNENRICKDCPSNRIVNAAKDKCLTSCAAALPEAEITNAAGNACLTKCSSAGEITNTAGDACLTSCTDGGEISDSDGNNQCNGNGQCVLDENQYRCKCSPAFIGEDCMWNAFCETKKQVFCESLL